MVRASNQFKDTLQIVTSAVQNRKTMEDNLQELLPLPWKPDPALFLPLL